MDTSHSNPPTIDQAARQILQKNFDADSKACFLTLLKILDNLLQKPGNEKVRSLRLENPAIRSKIVDKHGHHVLLACGFVHEPPDPKWRKEERLVLLPGGEDTELLVRARHTLARISVHELGLNAGDLPVYRAPAIVTTTATAIAPTTTAATAFDVYAGRRFDGQSAAAGTNLGPPEHWQSKTEQDLAKLKQREARLQRELALQSATPNGRTTSTNTTTTNTTKSTIPAIDRQWTVFLQGQAQAPSSQPAISSAEAMANSTALKLTSTSASKSTNNNNSSGTRGDSQLLASHFQQQHANRVASENRGFTTKAMRDLEKIKKSKVYSHTQLAIHFPDGLSVRANFATSERLGTVLEGLSRDVLFSTETLLLPDLQLYQTPPRRVLDPSKTLKELGLVPAAKVYASWKSVLRKPDGLGAGWYIQQDLLQDGGRRPKPVLPTSIPVVQSKSNSASGANNNTAKRKKTKAEKEAALMKRMLGRK